MTALFVISVFYFAINSKLYAITAKRSPFYIVIGKDTRLTFDRE